ncbi:hypothetical protein [Candidatus Soleaferrea massiliensis]|uniref:hypothetical protein n=1 Tax=Candidatus Soleaferrea massiliensis TaxID=1470354 RepID=UPI00058F6E64|nr:hypothetical protein [Candidatus Soleaferrea massiliensis]
MANSFSPDQINKLFQMASKQLGVSPEQLQNEIQSGKYNDLLKDQKNVDQVKKMMNSDDQVGGLFGGKKK